MGIYSKSLKISEDKNQEYTEYIREHICNVRKAFLLYKGDIETTFNLSLSDIDLLEQRITNHDKSKYSFEEFDGYRQFFYPRNNEVPNKELMNIAWLNHIRNNPHHWNYWVIVDEDGTTPIDMDKIYIAEMILDWIAMSIKFNGSAKEWYDDHKDKMILSDNTKTYLDNFMNNFKVKY